MKVLESLHRSYAILVYKRIDKVWEEKSTTCNKSLNTLFLNIIYSLLEKKYRWDFFCIDVMYFNDSYLNNYDGLVKKNNCHIFCTIL